MFATEHSAPLLLKDIGVGTLLWYKGFTSGGSWDCPAIIYRVSPKVRTFHVISLDDMRVQPLEYEVELNEGSPDSRRNMRLASVAEVDTYLREHGSKQTAYEIIATVHMMRNKKPA
jgi:hypothetical protein